VELLVIVSIIALLVGMLAPSIGKALQISYANTTRSMIATIDSACVTFMNNTESAYGLSQGFYPPSNRSLVNGNAVFDNLAIPTDVNQGRYLLPFFLTGYAGDAVDNADGWGLRFKSGGSVYGPYNGLNDAPMEKNGDQVVFKDAFDNDIYYYRYRSGGFQSADNSGGPGYLSDLSDKRKDFLIISPGADGEFGSSSSDTKADDDLSNAVSGM
jgi:type II secretory pathway pseudopilin PulG